MARFSANLTLLFGELPFLDRFEAAARAGFRAVEFVSPYDHAPGTLGALLDRHGLEVSVFNLPAGDWARGDRGLACDPRRAAEFRDGLPRAAAYARALRCPRVHLMAGVVPPGLARAEAEAAYAASVRLAAETLGAEGITVLLEAINDRDMPGYLVTGSAQALAVIDAVALPNVRFQYDAYHLHVMGEDLAAALDRAWPRLGHVQIADAPGRHEPGTGEIDLRGLLARLDARGWSGFVGCEYRPRTTTAAGLGWLASYGAPPGGAGPGAAPGGGER